MHNYKEIYLRNRYEIELPDNDILSFSLIDFTDNRFFDRPFGIVTASNPLNTTLDDEENRHRNEALYNELNSRYEILPAKGSLENHEEEGYLLFDITVSELLEIGQKYDQYAIFYNAVDRLMYLECENGKVIAEKER